MPSRSMHISALSLILLTLALISLSTRVQAHELRAVGKYRLEVGFLNEPALVDELNGVFVGVRVVEDGAPTPSEPEEGGEGHEGEPVGGAEQTLSAEVIVGGDAASKTLELSPIPGEPGAYVAPFIPTLASDYTFRIVGELDGQPIDERFSSGPETFDPVTDVAEMQFPERVPSNAELKQSLEELRQNSGGSGNSSDDMARALGIAGIIIGVIGAAVGGLAVATRRS